MVMFTQVLGVILDQPAKGHLATLGRRAQLQEMYLKQEMQVSRGCGGVDLAVGQEST